MDVTRNDPVCLASSLEERFANSYSAHENQDLLNLEQYWSTETHPDSYTVEPPKKKCAIESAEKGKMVYGMHINDIPTSYNVIGFKPHELIVVGTYVDKNIIPGFQYKVRKNFSEEYFFHGNALTLQSVGMGYGKRLTFQGQSLNKNKNFFWSDSYPHGYGLTFQAVTPDFTFRIVDTETSKDIGRVTVNNPACSVDVELDTRAQGNGQVQKKARVHFSGDVIFYNSCNKQNIFYEDMDIYGTAVIVRPDLYSKSKIKEIVLENFIVDNCILVPED